MLTFADWLTLREPADAAARSTQLADLVGERLAGLTRATVHDLGTGTGSMGRWLAPRIAVPQHWIMYDRDDDLLARAKAGMTAGSAETRNTDITRLTPEDLRDADLITASALLDMFTAEEVERVADTCAGVRVPVYFALSVTGDVHLTPTAPLDAEVGVAFNAHQRRTVHGAPLLGPDAPKSTINAFIDRGARVLQRSSPWILGSDQAELVAEWFAGWIGAACEQRPELAQPVEEYARRRLAETTSGRLRVTVGHVDLLAIWD